MARLAGIPEAIIVEGVRGFGDATRYPPVSNPALPEPMREIDAWYQRIVWLASMRGLVS
jgi:hypothetical protein